MFICLTRAVIHILLFKSYTEKKSVKINYYNTHTQKKNQKENRKKNPQKPKKTQTNIKKKMIQKTRKHPYLG